MNWNTRITKLLNIDYPIIQGGLAYLAYSELASSVSNAGGLGQITAMSLESPEALRDEIRKVKTLTHKPFGVNFAIGQHGRSYTHFLDVAVEENVPVVSVTGGNPATFFEYLKGVDIKKFSPCGCKTSSSKGRRIGSRCSYGCWTNEGGGHLGKDDISTLVLVPQVVDCVSIPVIASGGIGDGRGLMAALSLGAEGIEMGTRFIATKECVHAATAYKDALLSGGETDTTVIKRTLGAPGRAISNKWTEKILEIEKNNGGYEELKEYISGQANKNYIYMERLILDLHGLVK